MKAKVHGKARLNRLMLLKEIVCKSYASPQKKRGQIASDPCVYWWSWGGSNPLPHDCQSKCLAQNHPSKYLVSRKIKELDQIAFSDLCIQLREFSGLFLILVCESYAEVNPKGMFPLREAWPCCVWGGANRTLITKLFRHNLGTPCTARGCTDGPVCLREQAGSPLRHLARVVPIFLFHEQKGGEELMGFVWRIDPETGLPYQADFSFEDLEETTEEIMTVDPVQVDGPTQSLPGPTVLR